MTICNVGAGTTDIDLPGHIGNVVLIDPAFLEMRFGGNPHNVSRGHKHIAEPFALSHIPTNGPTVVVFEFSLHHVAPDVTSMGVLLEQISRCTNVMGVVLLDYHLHDHPIELLLRYHQTIFGTMAEQKEIIEFGIARSLRVHTQPVFPVVSSVLLENGFRVYGEVNFFPRLDSEYGDIVEGLTRAERLFIETSKGMQCFIRQ